jgi:hypothetical protein
MSRMAALRPSVPVATAWRVVLGLLGVVFAGAVAAEEARSTWVEILRQDDAGMELLLHAPPPTIEDGRVTDVPGFLLREDTGVPRAWARAALVAVPGQRGASLQIVSEQRRPLPGVRPELQWDPARGDAPQGDPTWKPTGPWPAATVRLTDAGELRRLPLVGLEYAPLQFSAEGAAEYVSEVRVQLQFRDRPRRSTQPIVDVQLRGVLNHLTATHWQRQQPAGAPKAVADIPSQRLRITIPETGIYALSGSDLEAAGVPSGAGGIDPRTLRLYADEWHWIPLSADSFSSWSPAWQMQEIDILVDGENNAVLDPGDRVLFYAVGPSAYLDQVGLSADSLAHATHPYDEQRYVWLVWDDGTTPLPPTPPRRMQQVSAAAPDPVTDPIINTVWHRQHFESDERYGFVDDLWYWQKITSVRPAVPPSFNLDLGGVDETTGTLRLGVGAEDFYWAHAFDTTINGVLQPTSVWNQGSDLPPNHYVTYEGIPLFSSGNNLQVARNTSVPSATGETLFLKYDVTWQRPLVATQNRLAWTHRQTAAAEVFELAGFGELEPNTLVVLDVTQHTRPVRLVDPDSLGAGSATLWRVRTTRTDRAHYRATTLPRTPQVQMRTIADLWARPRAPHMLIITENSLRAQVDRLVQHRRTHFQGDLMGDSEPDLLVTEVQDIYENFSGGRVDPLAIRNYIRSLYDKDTVPRLQFLLLFGEATHDPRGNLLSSTQTLVPTIQPWYADDRVRTTGYYAVDDWLAEMGAPVYPDNFGQIYPLPDFAVGRVTPRGDSDARLIVDKIIAFETQAPTGPWHTTVLLAADDEHHAGRAVETFHINNIEQLPPLVPTEWDIEKFYLTEYPLRLGQKPEARSAFIRRWSEGLGVIIYQGHGAPRQLADEVLFLGTDIPALVNGVRLPAFMAFSCTVAEFDDPELQSMAEEMLTSPVGGAIVGMGATTPTFAGPNARLNEQVFGAIWEFGPTSHVPLGTALMLGKQRSTPGTGKDNARYSLIGDPSVTLRTPGRVATFLSGADTLAAGTAASLTGRIEAADGTPTPGFQGLAEVAVYGSADESGYTSIYPPNVRINYDLRGAPLYRGEVPVVDGEFSFDFFVPLNAVLGDKGRLSISAAGDQDTAVGGRSDVVLQIATVVESDTVGPEIALRFPNDLTHVKPGTQLVAELQDPQGINIQGLTALSSILLDFDDSNQPLDITSFFRYQAGSATFGTVAVSVPGDLSPGPHTATMVASDNLQNPSSKSISFQVVEEQVTQLVNVVAFPNPFRDRTHFIFEITDAADVEIEVFTSSGRRVWRYRRDNAEAGQVNVEWRGVDHLGDEIANGTYLYRVRATPHQRGASSLDHIGKVVVVREG